MTSYQQVTNQKEGLSGGLQWYHLNDRLARATTLLMTSPVSDPIFGSLEPDGRGHWRTTVSHEGRELRADLNIDGELKIEPIRRLTGKLAGLTSLEESAREAMVADLARPRGSAVALYREHHQEQLAAIEAATGDQASSDDAAFLSACELIAVALYPEYPSHCLILDFKLREASSDYQLVVSFNADGQVAGIDMES